MCGFGLSCPTAGGRKFVAYADAAALYGLHRGHCYRVQFNDNPQYPIIEAMIEEIAPEGGQRKKL